MKNEHFKTQMFRFVDVLPYLNSGSEVARHLKEYFAEAGDELPSVFNFGVGLGIARAWVDGRSSEKERPADGKDVHHR